MSSTNLSRVVCALLLLLHIADGRHAPPKPLSPPAPAPEDQGPPPKPLSPPPTTPLPYASLLSLAVDGGELVPSFKEHRWKYLLLVPESASAVRITVFLAPGDEDFVVKLEGIPLANGIKSPPIGIDYAGSDVQCLRIRVTAVGHYPTTYVLNVERDEATSTTHSLLVAFLWFLGIVAVAFLAYGIYVYVVTGRERGWWPFRYYLRETPSPEHASLHSAPLLE